MSELDRAIAELPREVPPERDLWPLIEPRLSPRRPSWRPLMALAAAVLLAVAVWQTARGPASGPDTWEPELVAASQRLAATLDERRHELDPGTIRVIEANLDLIDRAIADCAAALSVDPDNAQLQTLLADNWRRRLELLRRANELPVGS